MTAVENSALLRLISTTEDPELSQVICEEVMEYAPSIVNYAMRGLVTMTKIDDVSDATQNTPMVARNAILGGVFGIYELLPAFIVSCIAIVVVSLLTREPSDEIKADFEKAKTIEC